jgi:mono/diheme cytochrome c family protein
MVLAAPRPPDLTRTGFDAPDVPDLLRADTLDRRALERSCLSCHGLPVIVGQRLTPEQWAAVVAKMREKFKAPHVPGSEDEERIVDLLARALPPERPAAPAARLRKEALIGAHPFESVPSFAAVSAPLAGADRARGADLFAMNCAPCHGPDALGGPQAPRLPGRAILADPVAVERLLESGRGNMPPLAGFDARAARDLLAHLRARTAEEGRAP